MPLCSTLRVRHLFAATLALLLTYVAPWPGKAADPAEKLFDVTANASLRGYVVTDCKAEVVSSRSGPALKLAFGHQTPWPSLKFQPERLGYSTDWSRFALLGVVVSNPTDVPVKVNVRVDSRAVKDRGRQGGVEVLPGQQVRLLMPIAAPPPIIGMRGQPPLLPRWEDNDVRVLPNRVALDARQIARFQIFLGRPDRSHTMLLHRIELIPLPKHGTSAFVDKFGQYDGSNWPGKLHSEDEFPGRVRAEQEYFQTHPPLADRDHYGGWKGGPQLEATGRFRVQKQGGKWWLVDPDGRLFWSSGLTCVRFNSATITAGREQYYAWLPGETDPLARFYSGRGRRRMFDFFQANAVRKYGKDFPPRFYDVTVKRFQAWGLNTIACWSSPDIWRLHRIPYTIPISVPRVPMFVASSHMKAGLEKKKWFPDPFDPKFRDRLEQQLAAQAEFKNDPWLLGVFIHNELPWTLGAQWRNGDRAPTGIAALCLQKSDHTLQAKRVLIDWLKAKYPSVAELDQKWGTTFASWEEMAMPFELTGRQQTKAFADLTELDRLVAQQYFRVCRNAMDKQMPGVLYLGCRFSGMYNRNIVEVAKQYCDVVSFNIYAEHPSDRTADELATELDFPVIIGEFHFGALDRGMFDPGLRRTKDQADRAARYSDYVRQAATAPWCVGAHWFQYLDQPLTGRPDGENYNIGFVDATDDPYPEMRDAARKVHASLYTTRAN